MLKRLLPLFVLLAGIAYAAPLTLPDSQRPDWLARDGIIMAGSWEPLLFRVRRDGDGYTPSREQRAAWEREHSPETVARLKALGVNFVMMHCYKGAGIEAERESMADAVQFAKLCHDAGMRVGVYNYSGAFLWEPLFKEVPQARDWVVLDPAGKPRPYNSKALYRYFWDRNHPDAQAYYRRIVKFAVEDIRADLLHFDNYEVGPGLEPNSLRRFREYLSKTFPADLLKSMKVDDPEAIRKAVAGAGNGTDFAKTENTPENLLRRAWLDFACQSLADSYHDMSRYARSLRPDVLIECNPGGVQNRIRAPVDHGRLLEGGEAFWDEGVRPRFADGRLESHIRTYKVARRMSNTAFAYTTNRLEAAEAMAFNRDCLGCICWFEYDEAPAALPGARERMSSELEPFVRFFKARRDLFRDAMVVADVAVLRSFPSQVFADRLAAQSTAQAEDALIENRMPFQIIHDQHLADLGRYRVLVLAGCPALSEPQADQVRRFAEAGGKVLVVGSSAGTHDEWFRPRKSPALQTKASLLSDLLPLVRDALGADFSSTVTAPRGVCAEFAEQPGRRLVHLVNYRPDPIREPIQVSVRLPAGTRATSATLASPEHEADIALGFREKDGRVEFAVPAITTYEIAVVAYEQRAK